MADHPFDENEDEDEDVAPSDNYVPDAQALWAAEACRALAIILTKRLGPDFAKELHNEIFARTIAYEAGCPDDRRDAASLQVLLADPFWDRLFGNDGRRPSLKGPEAAD
jgi:hypothetical protein